MSMFFQDFLCSSRAGISTEDTRNNVFGYKNCYPHLR